MIMGDRYVCEDDFRGLKKDLKEEIEDCKENFVHKNEFKPYKMTLNIIGGLIITGLAGALLALVLK